MHTKTNICICHSFHHRSTTCTKKFLRLLLLTFCILPLAQQLYNNILSVACANASTACFKFKFCVRIWHTAKPKPISWRVILKSFFFSISGYFTVYSVRCEQVNVNIRERQFDCNPSHRMENEKASALIHRYGILNASG